MGEFDKLKVAELKELLRERGLPLTGNKKELVARLEENAAASAPRATEAAATTAATATATPATATAAAGTSAPPPQNAVATETPEAVQSSSNTKVKGQAGNKKRSHSDISSMSESAPELAAKPPAKATKTATKEQATDPLPAAKSATEKSASSSASSSSPDEVSYAALAAQAKDTVIRQYLERLHREPWNVAQWTALFQYVSGPVVPAADARPYYDLFFARFPSAETFWAQRAQDELKSGNLDEAKQILDECIGIGDFESSGGRRFQHPDVYAAYVRVAKARFERDLTTKTEREDALQETYKQVFSRIGLQIDSNVLWEMHLRDLRERPVDRANEVVDADRKKTAQRALFKKVVVRPVRGINTMWREFQSFEEAFPDYERIGRVLIRDCETDFKTAEKSLRDRQNLWTPIRPGMLAVPLEHASASSGGRFGQRDELLGQLAAWQRYLEYEQANPHQLEPAKLISLVEATFERALCVLRFFPEMWFRFSDWHSIQAQKAELPAEKARHRREALRVLRRGCEAIPQSSILAFALAELVELYDDEDAADADTSDSSSSAGNPSAGPADPSWVFEEHLRHVQSPLVYINYMTAVRRLHGVAEDERIRRARAVFSRGRADAECGSDPELYRAAAEMELCRNGRADVARRIYFLGLARLAEPDVRFTAAFVRFVMHTGADDANVDLAVEQCVQALEDQEKGPAQLAELWRVYRDYCLRCRRGERALEHLREIDSRVERMYAEQHQQHVRATTGGATYSFESALYRFHYGPLSPDSTDDLDLLRRVRPFALTHPASSASVDMRTAIGAAAHGAASSGPSSLPNVASAGNATSASASGAGPSDGAEVDGTSIGRSSSSRGHRDPVPHFLRVLHQAAPPAGGFRKDVDELLEELRKPLPPRPMSSIPLPMGQMPRR